MRSPSVQGARDLWRQAFDALEPGEADLLKSNERHCADLNNILVDKGLREKKLKEWKFDVMGKTIKVRKLVQDILAVVEVAASWMKPVADADPSAAIALACVSSLLTAIMDAKKHSETMLAGLQQVSHLIGLYTTWDTLYTGDGDRNLRDAVVKLYTAILAYQARLLNYLDKNFAKRALRNLAKTDSWQSDLVEINERHERCQEFTQLADVAFNRQQREYHSLLAQAQIDLVRQMLDELRLTREQQLQQISEEKRMAILHSLSSDYNGQKNFNPVRAPGTCEWFINDQKFLDWRQSLHPSILQVSAGPGCGKSVLARHLIDSGVVRPSNDTLVTFFFFKDSQEGRNKSANAVASLLHQIFANTSRRSLIVHAIPSYEAHGDKLATMFDDLWDIFERVLQDPLAAGIVCVIDALDECIQYDRRQLLASLEHAIGQTEGHKTDGECLKILITSRPFSGIDDELSDLEDSSAIIQLDGSEKIDLIAAEIGFFIEHMVPRVLGPRSSKGTRDVVIEKLKRYENKTYLWLHLMFDFLRKRLPGRRDVREIERLIDQMPPGLPSTYAKMLQSSSDLEQARKVLTFVVSYPRTLQVDELRAADALARGGADAYKELLRSPQDDDEFKVDIQNICGLLLTFHDSGVYFIHQTARSFLVEENFRIASEFAESNEDESWCGPITKKDQASLRDDIFATLLTSDVLTPVHFESDEIHLLDACGDSWGEVMMSPLFEQAARYCAGLGFDSWREWNYGLHPLSSSATSKLKDIFKTSKNQFWPWFSFYRVNKSILWPITVRELTSMTQFEIACLFGQAQLAAMFLAEGAEVNPERRPATLLPLELACQSESTETIKLLIDNGADVNAPAGVLGTALSISAAYSGTRGMALLLENGADVNASGGFLGNALCTAASLNKQGKGGENINVLLAHGADVNAKVACWDPALAAANFQRPWMLESLMLAGAATDATELGYRTALACAIARDMDDLADILEAHGAEDVSEDEIDRAERHLKLKLRTDDTGNWHGIV